MSKEIINKKLVKRKKIAKSEPLLYTYLNNL